MQFIKFPKYSEDLQRKTLRDVDRFLAVLKTKRLKRIYRIAQKSWKRHSFFRRKHGPSDIILPIHNQFYELQSITYKSDVMIDAKVLFVDNDGEEIRNIRFIAEKKRYKTSQKARFRFNPSSFLRTEEIKTS